MANGWIVEHRCTQCGAPIALEEADRYFSCPFCRVNICLTTEDYFRYYLEPREKSAENIFYVPYWRTRGIIFSCDEALEVKSTILDATYCGLGAGDYPESLGLRPQALNLKFATPESRIEFPEPALAFPEAFARIAEVLPQCQAGNVPVKVFLRSFLGEKVSIVYAPFFIKNRALHDGILGRPLKALKDGVSTDPPPRANGHPLIVLPALCPECGWDLDGGRDSIVFFCRHCNKAWYLTGNGLEQKSFFVLRGEEGQTTHLPFWRIKAEIEGLDLRSMADLARVANLPVVIPKKWEWDDLSFWIPAFRVHAPLFLRLARLLTLQQPRDLLEEEEPLSAVQPASLSMGDAPDILRVIVASLVGPKKRIWPCLETLSAKVLQTDLVYIPFQDQKNDLFNPSLKVSVPWNSLKYGQYR